MPSPYGQGNYGGGLYSAGDTWALAGNLAPIIHFSGAIASVGKDYFQGNLAPSIWFAGSLNRVLAVMGNMAPQIVFSANLISGPLWAEATPCAPVVWQPAELCDG